MEKYVCGIAHAAYTVKDMDASVAFYEKVLGFEKAFVMNHPETGKPWIVYIHVAKDQFIELFFDGIYPHPYSDDNIGYSHLCLEVRDIQEAAAAIRSAGAPLDQEPSLGVDGNWQCWTHDPDGNRIELMQMMPDSCQDQYLKR